jgi:serine/threonine protein kinase
VDEVEFGRYRLLSLIGEGGMGKVYKAHDTLMDRDVAIKVLPPELATEAGYAQRFRREAYAAARLTEPHIIPIHEAGEIDGRLYLVMPVIGGIDVHSLLQRDGPMNPQRAAKVIEQLAAALDAAHTAGLVHRDVKPSNALMTSGDFTYLIDFGIARDADATQVTKTGAVVGTLAYMAPERFTTGNADVRADVYSLACMLHECLTGAQPYPGNGAEQQIAGHLTLDPPKPSSVNPAVPAAFDEVIARGMAKKPAERFSSAGELASAARAAASSRPGTRQFSARWPNPDGTGDTPYPEHVRIPEPADHKFGHGRLVLAAAAVATFLAAALIATVLILRENRASPSGSEAVACSR